jgi:hypothetical protein
VNREVARDVVGLLVFLPAVAVWLIALVDVLRRRDMHHRRRIATAVVITLVFPLTLLYLLGRPPSSVRHGPETADDPRAPLVRRLESGRALPAGPDDASLDSWVGQALAGDAPATR